MKFRHKIWTVQNQKMFRTFLDCSHQQALTWQTYQCTIYGILLYQALPNKYRKHIGPSQTIATGTSIWKNINTGCCIALFCWSSFVAVVPEEQKIQIFLLLVKGKGRWRSYLNPPANLKSQIVGRLRNFTSHQHRVGSMPSQLSVRLEMSHIRARVAPTQVQVKPAWIQRVTSKFIF